MSSARCDHGAFGSPLYGCSTCRLLKEFARSLPDPDATALATGSARDHECELDAVGVCKGCERAVDSFLRQRGARALAESHLATLRDQLAEYEFRWAKMRERITELETYIESCRAVRYRQAKEIDELSRRNQELEAEVSEWSKRAAVAELRLSEYQCGRCGWDLTDCECPEELS